MELLLALGDEVDDAAHAFGFVLGRGVGDDLYAADLRGGHALDHILEIVAHRCRIAPVEQYLVIALSVEQDVAVAVERELRNLADDLVERARRSLRVVLDRVGGLLGVGHYERFLDFDHHVADLDTLRDGDLAERLARCGHFHGLFVGRVAYHRDAELVVARFGGFEREAASLVAAFQEISERFDPKVVNTIYQTIHVPDNTLLSNEIIPAAEAAEQGASVQEISDMAADGLFGGGPMPTLKM